MVNKKDGYLYRLNRDTGEIDYIAIELYIFGNESEEQLAICNFRNANTAFSYFEGIPAKPLYPSTYHYSGFRFVVFWCFEVDNERAKNIFEAFEEGKLSEYKRWVEDEEDIIQKMRIVHPNGEGILPKIKWKEQ